MPLFPNNKFNYLKDYKLNNIINETNNSTNNNYSIISTKDKLYLNTYKNSTFSDNRELLESNDNITLSKLYKELQENANKMFEYYKNSQKMEEIPNIVLYYCSNN